MLTVSFLVAIENSAGRITYRRTFRDDSVGGVIGASRTLRRTFRLTSIKVSRKNHDSYDGRVYNFDAEIERIRRLFNSVTYAVTFS